jgi:hypothetical protein
MLLEGAIAFYGTTLTILDNSIENNSTLRAGSVGGGVMANANRTLISRTHVFGKSDIGCAIEWGWHISDQRWADHQSGARFREIVFWEWTPLAVPFTVRSFKAALWLNLAFC